TASPAPVRHLVDEVVGLEREEGGEVLAERDGLEHPPRLLWPAFFPRLVPDLVVDPAHLLVEDLADLLAGHLAVADPLPDLRAGDLGRRRVLHEVVDARSAAAPEPEGDVLEAD